MSINGHIINHEMKPMEMGGREEIWLKTVNAILIITEILPERITTSLIDNPSPKRATICRRWIIFIPISLIVAS
jgi:hypothetical protein